MRHLLSLREISAAEIEGLLDAAQDHADREGQSGTLLRGKTLATLFYEPSTRTELSFERAARRLGLEVLRCDVDHSSVQKGESVIDTARTLDALGADVLAIRHPAGGAPRLVAGHVACSVINAGDGMHEHPTQGLVDLLTVRRRLGRIAGLKIAIVGDVRHSRVARSAVWGFTKLGATVTFVGPATLLPSAIHHSPLPPQKFAGANSPGTPAFTIHAISESRVASHDGLPVRTTTSLEEGLKGADVIMALRMQLERQAGGDVPSSAEFAAQYGLTEPIIARTAPEAIIMHPGPMNIGIELREDVAYGPRSVIQHQVSNGVYVRMAALTWVLERASTQSPRSTQSSLSTDSPHDVNGDRELELGFVSPGYQNHLTGKTGKTGKTG